jgi:glycosyltransferase involved in cell wall biosynthesis
MSPARDSGAGRLLVISYHFPPDGAIGGQRWAGLSKYLARLGWEVHVITASPQRREDAQPGVHVHVCPRRRTLNDLYRQAARRLRQPSTEAANPARENAGLRLPFSLFRPIAALRRVVGSSMYLPDYGRGWVWSAARAGRKLVGDRDFDVVVSSGPPHSSHFAAVFATLGRKAQLWIDMRDPWSLTYGMSSPEDSFVRAERVLLRRLEDLIFSRASRVIVNTDAFAGMLRATRPQLEVVCFPNGIDLESMPPRDPNGVERGSMAHVGTLYARRNLSSVCAAMRSLLSDRADIGENLKLNIAGPMEIPHRVQMQKDIDAAGLGSVVSFHGVLPRAQALELLNRSHLALVLAQHQPMQVPAKLYECVGLGIPTLVIAESASAAASEALRIGAKTVDGRDEKALRAVLEDLLENRIPTTIAAQTPVSYEGLAIRMDHLLREAREERGDTSVSRESRITALRQG